MYRYLLVFLGLLSRLEGIWQETIKAIRLRLEFPLSLFSLTITSYRGRLSQVSPRLQTFKTVVDYMGLCCTIPQKGSQQNLVSFFWTSLLRRHSGIITQIVWRAEERLRRKQSRSQSLRYPCSVPLDKGNEGFGNEIAWAATSEQHQDKVSNSYTSCLKLVNKKHRSIAYLALPHGLLTHDPCGLQA